jgi:CheY-like chemotaxis protein
VLILDDDADTIESFAAVLVMEGVPVVQGARTIGEAESILEGGFRPSAVVLDLQLDGARGEWFAGQLQADPVYRTVPIIAVSGDQLALNRMRDLGYRGFLKPVDPAELLMALREVCEA